MTDFVALGGPDLDVDKIASSPSAYALYQNPIALFEGNGAALGYTLRAAALHGELGELLSEQDIGPAAVASVDFSNSLDWTTFDWYTIQFHNLRPVTNGTYVTGRVYIGGSVQSGATYRTAVTAWFSDGTTQTGALATQSFAYITEPGYGIPNGSADYSGASGEIHILNPSHGSKHTLIRGWFASQGNSGAPVVGSGHFAAYFANTGAVNGFRILMNSGNIEDGTFRLWGRRFA